MIIIQDHIVPFTSSSKNISHEASINETDRKKKRKVEFKSNFLTPEFKPEGAKTSLARIPIDQEGSSHHPSQVTIVHI